MQPIVYVIVGPTASGKSDFAVALAKRVNGEVISADSRQVYRGLDIGTGKITKKEMRGIRHHLLDVASAKRVFTVHDYVRMARPIIGDIVERGKTPIICGGTGFYIDALLGRISVPDVPPDAELRASLEGKSAGELHVILRSLDARRAREIDAHNPVRLIRAIEIATALGTVPPMKPAPLPYEVRWFGMKTSETSYPEIVRTRLRKRMKLGMLAEAKRLHAGGLSYKRMHDLGLEYRHLASLLQGHVKKDDMLAALERDILAYAKRQKTYWRRNAQIRWVSPHELPRIV